MLRKAASERVLYRMCTKTFTWRLLTGPELTEVYLNEMRRDFPAGELKPLSMILTSEAEGTAHTWGVFDGDTLAAYLLMVRPEGCRVSQLDYFAVVPAYPRPRHRGAAAGTAARPRGRRRSDFDRGRDAGKGRGRRYGGAASGLLRPLRRVGTPTTPSIFLTHGSAFWCWTARAAPPLPRRPQWRR